MLNICTEDMRWKYMMHLLKLITSNSMEIQSEVDPATVKNWRKTDHLHEERACFDTLAGHHIHGVKNNSTTLPASIVRSTANLSS